MLQQFLDQTCTITLNWITNDNWVEKASITTIYSNIPCHFYSISGWTKWSSVSINTPITRNKVIIWWDKVNVKKWMTIIITDPLMWLVWEFVIDVPPKPNRSITWLIDSIELTIISVK